MKSLGLLGFALWLFIGYCAGTPHHLGCFQDSDSDYDLDEIVDQVTVQVENCTTECRNDGFPYAGIRRASTCFCGLDYGKHGQANDTNCNYTCTGGDSCGGNEANSIYYTIDSGDDDERRHWAYDRVATFQSARKKCVSTDGDLITMEDLSNFTAIAQLFEDFQLRDSQRKFWLGMRSSSSGNTAEHECEDYQWVIANVAPFDCDANSDVWNSEENWQNECVVVDINTGKWETTNCYGQYPVLCHSKQRAEEYDPYEDYVELPAEEKIDTSGTKTALFIVLPFFFVCYGGSCMLYCIHKAYRNCRRRKNPHMLLERQESFTEFEPDTKPQKRLLTKVEKKNALLDGPEDESCPEPILVKKTSSFSLLSSSSAAEDSVRIDINSPIDDEIQAPPGYDGKLAKMKFNKVRAERRRAKLLENALMEARQRRHKENSPLENGEAPAAATETNEKPNRPASNCASACAADYAQEEERHPRPFESKASKASWFDDARRSSSPDDASMMSIADIMRVKTLMKEKKKKVRKILLS